MNDGSCPVCMTDVPLSSLDGCKHMFCMSCAVQTSVNEAVCPLCRKAFTTVSQTGDGRLTDELTYHVLPRFKGRFKIRGFVWVSAFCMGLANRLVFEAHPEDLCLNPEERLIMLPQYLRGMLGCHNLYFVSETYNEELEEGPQLEEGPHEEAFVAMEADLVAWKDLPLIYTRLVIARHIEAMIKKKIFMRIRLQTDAPYRADKILLCTYPVEEPFGRLC
jgi:hypothetical protein